MLSLEQLQKIIPGSEIVSGEWFDPFLSIVADSVEVTQEGDMNFVLYTRSGAPYLEKSLGNLSEFDEENVIDYVNYILDNSRAVKVTTC